MRKSTKLVSGYFRMWPREVFDCRRGGKRLAVRDIADLTKPGVYVLYRGHEPFYVGQAKRLRSRLWQHAANPHDAYYLFWDYFSAFVVEDVELRGQIEGVLIAAMPTANGAKPRIKKVRVPLDLRRAVHNRKHAPFSITQIHDDTELDM